MWKWVETIRGQTFQPVLVDPNLFLRIGSDNRPALQANYDLFCRANGIHTLPSLYEDTFLVKATATGSRWRDAIFLSNGLFQARLDDQEYLSVLAHETAHILLQHTQREKSDRQKAQQETSADQVACILLEKAGISREKLVSAIEKLEAYNMRHREQKRLSLSGKERERFDAEQAEKAEAKEQKYGSWEERRSRILNGDLTAAKRLTNKIIQERNSWTITPVLEGR